MEVINKLFEFEQYSIPSKLKNALLLDELQVVLSNHFSSCVQYRSLIENYYKISDSNTIFKIPSLVDLPFIHVGLFKEYQLLSCTQDKIVRVLNSSGTTSTKLSKIYLDQETAVLQTKALVSIIKNYLGSKRLPMLFIESKSILKQQASFSARVAGVLGFANFGYDHTYALNENMEIDWGVVTSFLERYKNQKILIFGFTYMIWQDFYIKILQDNIKLDLSQAILIHGGGWKKLSDINISNEEFKLQLNKYTQISKVYNYYGMVEQVGSIFMECEYGYLHTPNYADIIIRDPYNWQCAENGISGIIEVLSVLPRSYPGNIILTEDIGTIIGEDSCKCGRMGKYFLVHGRIPKAELRGCSDVYPTS